MALDSVKLVQLGLGALNMLFGATVALLGAAKKYSESQIKTRQMCLGIAIAFIGAIKMLVDNKIAELSAMAVASAQQKAQDRLESLQTGGDSYCYIWAYRIDERTAHEMAIIRSGSYPLYNVHTRVFDVDAGKDVDERDWGEISGPPVRAGIEWPLKESNYFRVFIHARNGFWIQDLILRRIPQQNDWVIASKVVDKKTEAVIYTPQNSLYPATFGAPQWRP